MLQNSNGVDIFLGVIEKIKNVYLPAYFQWLTEKLSHTEPFTALSVAVGAIFVMVVFVWFRNRNA